MERFTREIAPLILTGPPSVTGFAGGRPKVEEIVAYWPTLIPKAEVQPENRFYKVTPKGGKPVVGRLLNRDTYTVQLMDLDERLRSFRIADLAAHDFDDTPMPSAREKLSMREIADVVSYLSSLRGITP